MLEFKICISVPLSFLLYILNGALELNDWTRMSGSETEQMFLMRWIGDKMCPEKNCTCCQYDKKVHFVKTCESSRTKRRQITTAATGLSRN